MVKVRRGFFVLVLPAVLCGLVLLMPSVGEAAAKKDAGVSPLAGVKIHLTSKMEDGDWFTAKTKKINKQGVLEYKNVVPGWGRVELAGNPSKEERAKFAGKFFTLKLQLLDSKGRRLREVTPVDIYVKHNGKKTFVETLKTDEKGWLVVPHGMIGMASYMDVKGKGDNPGNNEGKQPRIAVRAKMGGSDWFTALRDRVDKDRVLTLRNVTSGKSEFRYIEDDKDDQKITGADLINSLNQQGKLSDKLAEHFLESDFAGKSFYRPFTLKVQVLDDDGHRITKPTKVKMTVYLKDRTIKGTLKTDSKGWMTIKGVPVNIVTKMEVQD